MKRQMARLACSQPATRTCGLVCASEAAVVLAVLWLLVLDAATGVKGDEGEHLR